MKINDIVKSLRESENLTQEEMSKKIGVSKQAIQKYESGESKLGTDKVEKYAEYFGISPAYIMGWTEDKMYGLLTKDSKDSYGPIKDFVAKLISESKVRSLDGMSAEMYRSLLDLNEKCLLDYLQKQFQKPTEDKV